MLSCAETYNRIVDRLFKQYGITLDYNSDDACYVTPELPWSLAERIIQNIKDSFRDEEPNDKVRMYTYTPVSGDMQTMKIGFAIDESDNEYQCRLNIYAPWRSPIRGVPISEQTTIKELVKQYDVPTHQGRMCLDGKFCSDAPFSDVMNTRVVELLDQLRLPRFGNHILQIVVKMSLATE